MDQIYRMTLHQTITVKPDGDLPYEITRVPGGWVYRFVSPLQISGVDGQWSENYLADSVFVPFNAEFRGV